MSHVVYPIDISFKEFPAVGKSKQDGCGAIVNTLVTERYLLPTSTCGSDIYFIYCRNEGGLSSVCDVDRYVITRKLLDYTALNDILHLLWERGCPTGS
jgi:hypothetical protein